MKIDLRKGDCLDIMKDIPNDSVDLVVTDPPYKVTARGNSGNSGGMLHKKEVKSGKVFTHNTIEIDEWLPELYRVLKDKSHCYIMTNNKNITHYLNVIKNSKFHFIKNLIWVKDNKIMGQTYMSQFEYVIMVRKGGHKRINDCGVSDVAIFKNKKLKDEHNKNLHDTEKPVNLCEMLINNSSNNNDAVLDPFMGIGGAGVACVNTNRNFIGIELDGKYFEIAKKRINDDKLSKR